MTSGSPNVRIVGLFPITGLDPARCADGRCTRHPSAAAPLAPVSGSPGYISEMTVWCSYEVLH